MCVIRNRTLYIVFVLIAVLILAGLLILAINMDRVGGDNSPTGPANTSNPWAVTFEQYLNMTKDERKAFQDSFTDPEEDFKLWRERALSSYDTTGIWEATYEEYLQMTPEQQIVFYNQFADPARDFFVWHTFAKAEYDESRNEIEIGQDGYIDIGGVVNGNNKED